jgi:gamma-glutamyltranspeptidase/glutathione hydrolase
VTPYLARAIAEDFERIEKSPDLAAVLAPGGRPAGEGDVLSDAELANTLGLIARHGRKAFYEGEVAAAIAAACRDVDGAVRAQDLADYTVVWRQPVVGTYRGFDVVGMPPPASGGAVIVEALNVLEPAEFDRRGKDPALSYHLLAEAMKHGFADRATSFGDPDFVSVPLARLVSKGYAADLSAGIDAARTRPSWAYGDSGTTHVSVVDAKGNAVALTTSVNGLFGSGVRAPQAGVLLNNTIDDFSIGASANIYGLVGSKKNRIAPGKRPLSSMSPTIVLQDGRVRLVAGGAGGPRIISATLQTVLGVIAEGRSAAEAVDAPRIHHQWQPDVLLMETRAFGTAQQPIMQSTADALTARGHTLDGARYLAAVNAVEVVGARAIAAPDPRKRTPPAP